MAAFIFIYTFFMEFSKQQGNAEDDLFVHFLFFDAIWLIL